MNQSIHSFFTSWDRTVFAKCKEKTIMIKQVIATVVLCALLASTLSTTASAANCGSHSWVEYVGYFSQSVVNKNATYHTIIYYFTYRCPNLSGYCDGKKTVERTRSDQVHNKVRVGSGFQCSVCKRSM